MNNKVSKEHPKCPSCGADKTAIIIYGLPDYEAIHEIYSKDEYTVGGCDFEEDSPKWFCNSCRHEWGESSVSTWLKENKAKEIQKEIKKREATNGPARNAFLNPKNGTVKCPVCSNVFRPSSKKSFKNGIHLSCNSKLNIIKNGFDGTQTIKY
jgi:rubredoxin